MSVMISEWHYNKAGSIRFDIDVMIIRYACAVQILYRSENAGVQGGYWQMWVFLAILVL